MSQSSSSDVKALAKAGDFDELQRRWMSGERFDLPSVFDRAVTDFRTVKRCPGHLAILKFCVDQGMDMRVRSDWLGQTPLCSAARCGNVEFVDYVVNKFGMPDDSFARAAIGDVGVTQGRNGLIEVTDRNGFNLLHYVAGSGLGRRDKLVEQRLTKICDCLIDQNVSTVLEVHNEICITPALMCAWFGENRGIMERLLSVGEIDMRSLHQAVEFALEPHQRSGPAFHDVAEVMLRYGFDVNSVRIDQGRMLLHGSAHRGATRAVEWLLAHSANPNALDLEQRTPLHLAAIRNTHAGVASLLLKAGADRNKLEIHGRTAMDYAQEKGRLKVAAVL